MKVNLQDETAVAQAAVDILRSHAVMVIATASPDGQPWAVPVHSAYDTNGDIIWKSAKDSRHSRELRANQLASIVLFSNSEVDGDAGLYLEGEAVELVDATDIQVALECRYGLRGENPPPAEEFMGESLARIYQFKPAGLWITEASHLKTPVNIQLFRQLLQQDKEDK